MRQFKTFVGTIIAVAAVLGLIGCIIVPGSYQPESGPRPESQIGKPGDRGKPLRLNEATLDDVRRVLGEPESIGDGGHSATYRYTVTTWSYIGICGVGQWDGEVRLLTLSFGPDGHLNDFKVIKPY